MNAAHAHLILNHVPVVGLAFAAGLLGWGVLRKSEHLARAGMVALVLLALVAIPVYLTGEPAEGTLKGVPGVATGWIEQHEDAAGVALGGILAAGAVALVGLWLFRGKPVAGKFAMAMLLISLVAGGLMAYTANLGGKIRHTETGGPGAPPSGETRGE